MPRDVQRPWSPGSGDIVGTIRMHMARVTSLCNVLHSSSLCRPPHSDFSRDRRRSPLHGQVNNVQREVARKRRLADHEEPQTAVSGIVFLLTRLAVLSGWRYVIFPRLRWHQEPLRALSQA